jgi:hypothetical protein
MATKKKNRRVAKKRVRRALNRSPEFFRGITGRKLNNIHYGQGLGSTSVIVKEAE